MHLEGKPSEIGFQHGYLLAPEILDAHKAIKLALTHDSKDWKYFRNAAEKVLWPHIEQEYREELTGIVAGPGGEERQAGYLGPRCHQLLAGARPLLRPWAEKNGAKATADHCSAFVATGSYTKDGKPVIAHNYWTRLHDRFAAGTSSSTSRPSTATGSSWTACPA